MLHRFGEEIWLADGSTVSVAGFAYPTRMIVIRLADGGLFLWSPIAIGSDLRDAVDRLGPVRHLVAPNTLHHLFVGDWQRAYPDATLHALPALRARRPTLGPGRDLGDEADPAWRADIDQVVVRGNLIATEVVFFHRRSRCAIFTDLLQQFDRGWFVGWRATVAGWDRLIGPAPAVPNKFRLAFHNRKAARRAVRRILDWPTETVLAAHAAPVREGGRTAIADAFAWLMR